MPILGCLDYILLGIDQLFLFLFINNLRVAWSVGKFNVFEVIGFSVKESVMCFFRNRNDVNTTGARMNVLLYFDVISVDDILLIPILFLFSELGQESWVLVWNSKLQ